MKVMRGKEEEEGKERKLFKKLVQWDMGWTGECRERNG